MSQRKQWFEKFIGCCFGIDGEEYIFQGTYSNTETSNGKPYQYVFEAEGKPQVLVTYKEARSIMGAMIDNYSKGR
ncbi:hypothetical protein MHB54_00845 [Paenibacillus sp. FSL M7-0802]|uniref:hypothetical protein n=1 Tax=Paenibacillus sp. FSL M7-0802 TaxID=2921536 RepID=UPI0030F5B7EB